LTPKKKDAGEKKKNEEASVGAKERSNTNADEKKTEKKNLDRAKRAVRPIRKKIERKENTAFPRGVKQTQKGKDSCEIKMEKRKKERAENLNKGHQSKN